MWQNCDLALTSDAILSYLGHAAMHGRREWLATRSVLWIDEGKCSVMAALMLLWHHKGRPDHFWWINLIIFGG